MIKMSPRSPLSSYYFNSSATDAVQVCSPKSRFSQDTNHRHDFQARQSPNASGSSTNFVVYHKRQLSRAHASSTNHLAQTIRQSPAHAGSCANHLAQTRQSPSHSSSADALEDGIQIGEQQAHGSPRTNKLASSQTKSSGRAPSRNFSCELDLAHHPPPSPTCSVCDRYSELRSPVRVMPYEEIEQATNNFSRRNFLAEGESAFVYRGALRDGKQVAVKAVERKSAKLHSEIHILASVQHPNVVSLLGYCQQSNKLAMLVYDFVCNGTLAWHISDRNPNVVPWSARRLIAIQVARGLQFLHEHPQGCLIHGDIRLSNILLTHDYTPVIAGFGQARWAEEVGDEEVQTSVSRTLTAKSDVYAFGVLLLELISGRKVMDHSRLPNRQFLVNWIVDRRLESNYTHYELVCMVNAASMCIREDPATRPRMRQILSYLEDVKERILKNGKPLLHFIQSRSLSSSPLEAGNCSYTDEPPRRSFSASSSDALLDSNNRKKKERKRAPKTVTWQLPHSPSSSEFQAFGNHI